MITYDEFLKTELRVATVKTAERVEGSEKLIRLEVDAGDKNENGDLQTRQIVAGIGKRYEPGFLIGKQIMIVANLEPRKLMGLESRGMLLAASSDGGPIILMPEQEVPAGSGIQ
jgi:methionine--tRNA ligase beta chain